MNIGVLVLSEVFRIRMESLEAWYLVCMAAIHRIKRLLFVFGPVEQSVCRLVLGTPVTLSENSTGDMP